MEEREGKDLEVKSSDFIGISSENDNLVISTSSTSTVPDDALLHNQIDHQFLGFQNEANDFELSGDVNADKAEDRACSSQQTEQLPQLLETPEPARTTKIGKCNLRKSLAWDNAFFTSAGVLDPEELSSMIDGGGKGVKHRLPGIEEDVQRSMDSISTLENENLTLEGLEAELFEDIRASIQRTSKASKVAISSSKTLPAKMETHAKANNSSKKTDQATGYRSALRSRDSSSSTSSVPQPSKVIDRINPVSTVTSKRASFTANHMKIDKDIAKRTTVSSKGTQVSKVTELSGPRRAMHKPVISSKSSSLNCSTTTKIETTRSSSGSSSSSSSGIGKPATVVRKKIDPKTSKSTSGAIPRTPSRIVPKNKIPSVSSRPSVHLKSADLSPSISPASSISEWSSESSSTASTVNRRSASRVSLDTSSSCMFSSSDVPAESGLTDRISEQIGNQMEALSNQNTKNALAQTGSLCRPPSAQPSGLRMPSPKIGFFDGAKPIVRTPNGGNMQSQSRLPTGLPKIGAAQRSSIGTSNKTKAGKPLPPKPMTQPINRKSNTPKSTSPKKSNTPKSTSPKASEELSSISSSISCSLRNMKDCPILSPELDSGKSVISCLKTMDEEKDEHIDGSQFGMCINTDILEKKIAPCSDSCVDLFHGVGEGAVSDQGHLMIKPTGETMAKENSQFHNQVDSLLADVGTMEPHLEMSKKVEKPLGDVLTDSSRLPFADKNSLCKTDGSDNSIGSGIDVVEKITNLPSSELCQKENI